jgi:hypothetical protein
MPTPDYRSTCVGKALTGDFEALCFAVAIEMVCALYEFDVRNMHRIFYATGISRTYLSPHAKKVFEECSAMALSFLNNKLSCLECNTTLDVNYTDTTITLTCLCDSFTLEM